MKLTKHEKILISSALMFILLSVFCAVTQQNNINVIKHSETESVQYLIDINKAGPEELTSLSGIGPAIANRIIEYRTQNGNFKSTDELCNVSGIGKATLKKIEDYIKV
ncbi:MAG: helix-hairpin-helix domain-containing protein [Oscillospiraceae bacterium]|nr:helix-hairpin-helix domain-containing protein [Oscillospiraceae bacterium]